MEYSNLFPDVGFPELPDDMTARFLHSELGRVQRDGSERVAALEEEIKRAQEELARVKDEVRARCSAASLELFQRLLRVRNTCFHQFEAKVQTCAGEMTSYEVFTFQCVKCRWVTGRIASIPGPQHGRCSTCGSIFTFRFSVPSGANLANMEEAIALKDRYDCQHCGASCEVSRFFSFELEHPAA